MKTVLKVLCLSVGMLIVGFGLSLVFGPNQTELWMDFYVRVGGLLVTAFGGAIAIDALDRKP